MLYYIIIIIITIIHMPVGVPDLSKVWHYVELLLLSDHQDHQGYDCAFSKPVSRDPGSRIRQHKCSQPPAWEDGRPKTLQRSSTKILKILGVFLDSWHGSIMLSHLVDVGRLSPLIQLNHPSSGIQWQMWMLKPFIPQVPSSSFAWK